MCLSKRWGETTLQGNSKLFRAIRVNDLGGVKHLVQSQKAYLNSRDKNGITPLISSMTPLPLPITEEEPDHA